MTRRLPRTGESPLHSTLYKNVYLKIYNRPLLWMFFFFFVFFLSLMDRKLFNIRDVSKGILFNTRLTVRLIQDLIHNLILYCDSKIQVILPQGYCTIQDCESQQWRCLGTR